MNLFGIEVSAAVLWLIAAGLLAILEAFTLGLTSIWFAGGAAAAAIAAMLGCSLPIQIAVFLVISILLIIVTRPLAKKKLNANAEKTNVDAVIGQEGIAVTEIRPHEIGQVRADGKIWSAVCDGGEIRKDAVVVIKNIKGVTLTVEEKKQEV